MKITIGIEELQSRVDLLGLLKPGWPMDDLKKLLKEKGFDADRPFEIYQDACTLSYAFKNDQEESDVRKS